MILYTTCRDCGGNLHVTDHDNVHPCCEPKPTRAEQLAAQWLDAAERGADSEADRLQADIDEIDSQPPRLAEAALRYARWGWPVFPLRAGTKVPATPHGFKDATTDLARIKTWWDRFPSDNIGLATGHRFDVIDIDTPINSEALMSLLASNTTAHGHVATSSGGIHFYVKATGRGNTVHITDRVDIRGVGGYVVAPPSTLGPKGRAWSWVSTPSPVITREGDCYGV